MVVFEERFSFWKVFDPLQSRRSITSLAFGCLCIHIADIGPGWHTATKEQKQFCSGRVVKTNSQATVVLHSIHISCLSNGATVLLVIACFELFRILANFSDLHGHYLIQCQRKPKGLLRDEWIDSGLWWSGKASFKATHRLMCVGFGQ